MFPPDGEISLTVIFLLLGLSFVTLIVGFAQIYRAIKTDPKRGMLHPAQLFLTIIGGALGVELGWLIPAVLIGAALLGVYTIREDPGSKWLAMFGMMVTWGVSIASYLAL